MLPSPERTAHGISTSTSITKLAMNATLVARRATASMKLTASHALGADTYGSKKHQAWIGSVFHAILLPCYMALQEIVWSAAVTVLTLVLMNVTMGTLIQVMDALLSAK